MTSQSAAFVLDYVMLTRMLPKMLLPGGILELMVYSQQVRPPCPTGNWCEAHETWETVTYRDSQNRSQQMIQGYGCLMVLGGWHIIPESVPFRTIPGCWPYTSPGHWPKGNAEGLPFIPSNRSLVALPAWSEKAHYPLLLLIDKLHRASSAGKWLGWAKERASLVNILAL